MNRTLLIAATLSLLLHAGVAFSGYFFPAKAAARVSPAAIPTIEIELPPPPEPEPPELVENRVGESAPASSDIVPPMQADLPTARIDSPFVQPLQAPPPPGLSRSVGTVVLPVGPPRSSLATGLGNIFNLADLDEQPRPLTRISPVYPFDMRRSGLNGEVVVEFTVDSQGRVRDAVVVRSTHPGFEQSALDAVTRWTFKPGRKGGVPQNARFRQPLTFSLKSD